MMRPMHGIFVVAVVLICRSASDADARSIALNFSSSKIFQQELDQDPPPQELLDGGCCMMAETDIAGVDVRQGNWNNSPFGTIGTSAPGEDDDTVGTQADIVSPTMGVLVDAEGVPTAVEIDWVSEGSWRSGQIGGGDTVILPSNGDERMHWSGLDTINLDFDKTIKVNFANINSVILDPYDVYVYVGADQDNRKGRVILNGDADNFICFVTNTDPLALPDSQPGGYTEATATSCPTAFPSDYVHYENLSGDNVTIEIKNNGNPGVLLHGIQIVGESAGSDPIAGDMDCDGDVDFDDINDFVLGLNDPAAYQDIFGIPPSFKGDIDGDGDQDFDDIGGFVALLSGGGSVGEVLEPTTAMLATLGLMGLFAYGWRRRST